MAHPMWFQQEMVLQNQELLLSFQGWQLPLNNNTHKNITHSSDQQILTGLQAFTISPKKLIAKQILFIINDPQDCALEAPECPGY